MLLWKWDADPEFEEAAGEKYPQGTPPGRFWQSKKVDPEGLVSDHCMLWGCPDLLFVMQGNTTASCAGLGRKEGEMANTANIGRKRLILGENG